MEIIFQNQHLILHPKKAIFWKEQSLLIIADLHLGKISHFRKSGVGLPSQAIAKNLNYLAELLTEVKPSKVLFLGDLFHSDYNLEWESFVSVIKKFDGVDFQLLIGNHDILPKQHYESANLTVIEEQLTIAPFVFTHEPIEMESDFYQLSGHIHPGVKLRGNGVGSVVIPCFYFGEKQAILPAFGYFTGLYKIKPQKSDMIFGVVEETVVTLQ